MNNIYNMTKVIMLGTGNGITEDLYNTCFVIKNDKGVFLVDTGGSVEIIKRLRKLNIGLDEVNNIFISHSHMDHLLGLIWMFKKMYSMVVHGEIKSEINIYCNDVVYEAIKGVAKYVLPDKLTTTMYDIINFVILNDGDRHNINGIEYEFFDILARKVKQFGFECMLNNKRFIFLGDETLNQDLYERVKGADFVLHEAFCLDLEENIFHAYEKSHSTALSVAKVMNNLDVKNLVIYHTEESHGNDRKKLYTKEAQRVFDGNVFVPNDLEEINI